MRPVFLLLVLALVSVPLASAQTPTYTVTLSDVATTIGPLGENATANAAGKVALALDGVVCTTAVVVPVTIAAAAAGGPAGFTVVSEPAVVNITIGQGPHPSGTPGGGQGDFTLKAATGVLTANATVTITVTATAPAPAGPPTGCAGAGAISAATSAPATLTAQLNAPPPPPVVEPTPEDKGFLPGPGALMGILAAVVVALVARPKRG